MLPEQLPEAEEAAVSSSVARRVDAPADEAPRPASERGADARALPETRGPRPVRTARRLIDLERRAHFCRGVVGRTS